MTFLWASHFCSALIEGQSPLQSPNWASQILQCSYSEIYLSQSLIAVLIIGYFRFQPIAPSLSQSLLQCSETVSWLFRHSSRIIMTFRWASHFCSAQTVSCLLRHCGMVNMTSLWASHFCSAPTVSWHVGYCFLVIMTFLWASHFCRPQSVSWLYRHFTMVVVDLFHGLITLVWASHFCSALKEGQSSLQSINSVLVH